MIVELIALIILWINNLPPLPSIVEDISTRQIITEMTVDCIKNFQLEFGKYTQVHEARENTMHTRINSALTI